MASVAFTRHEIQRADYVRNQISETVQRMSDLSHEQKNAVMQAVSEKVTEMLNGRQFANGIPIKIAIVGNQFNIVPPVPTAKKIRDAALAATTGAVFASSAYLLFAMFEEIRKNLHSHQNS